VRSRGHLYLFPGGRGRAHVTGTTVGNWVAEVAEAAQISRVVCHELRHSAITALNDRTGNLRAVQAFARHARPETTALYTRVSDQRLTAAVESIDYLD
jgi:integrase/recombinase XerC